MRRVAGDNAGFTLLEFTVANAITMVVLAGTFQLLNMAFKVNSSIGEVMSTQQNIRVAMNTIARDITMAGTGLPDGGIAIPNGAGAVALTRPGAGGTLPTGDNVIPILSPGNSVVTVAGTATDVITVVSIDQESPAWTVTAVDPAGTQVSFAQDIRAVGTWQMAADTTVLVFSSPNGACFGVVTSVSATASQANFAAADVLNLNQPAAAAGNIKSLKNADGTYPPMSATRVNLITYYLNNSNPAHPRLMRAVNAQTPQVTVEDVDNLQFSYDLFDFDTNVSTSNQPSTTSPNQIRSVNIQLNGRSPAILSNTKDFYRFGLVSKVNIRNATFRNRYEGT